MDMMGRSRSGSWKNKIGFAYSTPLPLNLERLGVSFCPFPMSQPFLPYLWKQEKLDKNRTFLESKKIGLRRADGKVTVFLGGSPELSLTTQWKLPDSVISDLR